MRLIVSAARTLRRPKILRAPTLLDAELSTFIRA